MSATDTALESPPEVRPTSKEMFIAFFLLGATSFGGVLPISYRILVDERRWLDNEEYAELLGLCQFLPGGNVINLAVAVGMKFRGMIGALCSIVGLIGAPLVIVLLMGVVYDRFQNDPVVHHLFAGLAATTSGLLIAMSIKLGWPLRKRWPLAVIAVLCFFVIAVLRWPMFATMLVLTPISVFIVWKRRL
jgi:chromate transporter